MEREMKQAGSNYRVYDCGELLTTEFIMKEDEAKWVDAREEEGLEVRKCN